MLIKTSLFFLVFFYLSACSQKSEVTPFTKPQKISEYLSDAFSHNEGVIINGDEVTIPLEVNITDNTLDGYGDDPVKVDVPIVGALLEQMKLMFYNMAITVGMGKTHVRVKLPIPDLNYKVLKGFTINKIFFVLDNRTCIKSDLADGKPCSNSKFYIKPKKIDGGVRVARNPNFRFLDKALFNIQMHDDFLHSEEKAVEIFDMKQSQFYDLFHAKSLFRNSENLASYNSEKIQKEQMLELEEQTFYVMTSEPMALKDYLIHSHDYKDEIVSIKKSTGMLIIRTKKSARKLIKKFKNKDFDNFDIQEVKSCGNSRCLLMKTSGKNLLPLLREGRSADFNVLLDLSSVPRKAFWLKGYVEVSLTLDFSVL